MGKEVKTRGKGQGSRVGTQRPRQGHPAGTPHRVGGGGQEVVLGAWDSDFKTVQLKLWALRGQSRGWLRPPG